MVRWVKSPIYPFQLQIRLWFMWLIVVIDGYYLEIEWLNWIWNFNCELLYLFAFHFLLREKIVVHWNIRSLASQGNVIELHLYKRKNISRLLETRTIDDGIKEFRCLDDLAESYKSITCHARQWMATHFLFLMPFCALVFNLQRQHLKPQQL